ncbi:hypothetical protein LTR56_005876 [Elasticomyces elasticus]|nr:hypothetical protein LTR56_005876 [Elasticomyces elasticus]KAK4912785.1 hypothetical protein LTR49_018854 [Elasticomyces elasticus]KAK5752141.1 hypothetical protein LTS12_017736 [Elasticomyces elasticus]
MDSAARPSTATSQTSWDDKLAKDFEKDSHDSIPTSPIATPQPVHTAQQPEHDADVEKDGESQHPTDPADEKAAFLVKWDDGEKANPRNWSNGYKAFITWQLGMLALSASLGSSIIAPAEEAISEYTGVSQELTVLCVSLYVLGFAFGPLLWAPVSEVYGRKWSMEPAMIGLALFSIGTAVSKNAASIFITRFFGGVFGSAPVSNVSAALGDMYEPRARGIAVTFYAVCVVGGPTIGPVIGSALTANSHLGWRWVEYIEAIWVFAVVVLTYFCMPEMYGPTLLKWKAQRLRKETGDQRYWHPHEAMKITFSNIVTKHLSRPIVMLTTEPMVTCIAIYASFVYGLLYLTLEVFPIVYRQNRGMGQIVSTLPFLGLFVGVLFAVGINLANQPRYARIVAQNKGRAVPEARLPPMLIGGFLFTLGLFWFGWTADPKFHWSIPTIATAFIGAGFNVIFQQCINFLVDTYSLYAASAVSANTFLRSLFAFGLPLAARPMFHAMGVGPACSVLGGVACLALPVPLLFMKYGLKLRKMTRPLQLPHPSRLFSEAESRRWASASLFEPRRTMTVTKDSKIIIVGAGVFGLTTALHLSQRGYSNVHIFDRQPYNQNRYAVSLGADAASADENKIVRASYGDRKLYQDLAFAAMPEWQRWNEMLASTPSDDLPSDLTQHTRLWDNCGYLRLSDNGLEDSEKETQKHFPAEIRHTQYRVSDEQSRADAMRDGITASKIDPFGRMDRALPADGVLDMTAGYVLASRACSFALYLCQEAGVDLHLGPDHALRRLLQQNEVVSGIATADDQEHSADLVIVACGGWTPSLVSQAEQLLETTSGSVLSIRLPKDRPDLWDKYSPEQFPVWDFNMGSYGPYKTIGGIYGLPRTPEGVVKIAFRGAKWTDYSHNSTVSGKPLSYPKTHVDKVPKEAMRVIRGFCEENLPDLLELDLEYERLCWYTDSANNSFLIDYVPGTENLMVASGGSGHGFKFLPVLGQHIVDVVERKETQYTRLFAWRDVPHGSKNGLEEGPDGWRRLDKQKMVGRDSWKPSSKL